MEVAADFGLFSVVADDGERRCAVVFEACILTVDLFTTAVAVILKVPGTVV